MAVSVDTYKISSRLKELKIIKNLKQDDLINVTGTSRATISNYEQGKVKPPVEFLMKISKTYNISLDWLCGLSDTANGVEYTTHADLWGFINKLKEAIEFINKSKEAMEFINKSKKVINFINCITNIADAALDYDDPEDEDEGGNDDEADN